MSDSIRRLNAGIAVGINEMFNKYEFIVGDKINLWWQTSK